MKQTLTLRAKKNDIKRDHGRTVSLDFKGLKDTTVLHNKLDQRMFSQETVMSNPFKFQKTLIPGLRVIYNLSDIQYRV